MPSGVPDQGRHPGDADRRGHDRALKIALIRLRLLGDVIFTTPVVSGIRRAFPTAQLTYVVEPAAAPILQGNRLIDQLIVLPRRRGFARVRDDMAIGRRLRRERFDIAIDLHGGPRSAWLTWASRAPMRIGYIIAGRTWMYTHPVSRTPEPSQRHSVLNQWDLLAPLGIAGAPDPGELPVEMPASPEARASVESMLTARGIPGGAPLVLIHVSASNPFKRWPATSFADVIAHLVRHHPARHIAVVSGPSEPDAAEAVAAAARLRVDADASRRISSLRLDLPELRAMIARCAVYIGGDSGPLHVASTTPTPIVELLGPTVATRSFPWRPASCFSEIVDAGPLPCRPCDERTCIPGDFRCLTRITPDRVVQAAERAMALTVTR
jgi:ADP-heptose:LPS heptosyltransferase